MHIQVWLFHTEQATVVINGNERQDIWTTPLLPLTVTMIVVCFACDSCILSVPCPVSLPGYACFGGTLSPADWEDVKLSLEITQSYVQGLLERALEVEHATIPLYLTTAYSILNQSSFEALTIRSVFKEGTVLCRQ